MTRRVHTRASADVDVASQLAWYLQNTTPELAERFLGAVQETAETLLEFPNMGFRHGFRQPALTEVLMHPVKGFEKHLLLYIPTEDGIDLIRVYHAARDIDEIDPKGL